MTGYWGAGKAKHSLHEKYLIHKENTQIHKEMTETFRSSRPDVLCKNVLLEI